MNWERRGKGRTLTMIKYYISTLRGRVRGLIRNTDNVKGVSTKILTLLTLGRGEEGELG